MLDTPRLPSEDPTEHLMALQSIGKALWPQPCYMDADDYDVLAALADKLALSTPSIPEML